MRINKHDTNGTKALLQVGEFGYDNFSAGGDVGRVYVGNGSANIAMAKKAEVTTVDGKVDTHTARADNPHSVTKTQVGLGNVQNVDTTNASNITSGTLANVRLANSGVTAGTYKSVTVDGKGIVTGGTNPTTLGGYGITDAYTKTETNTQISTAVSVLVDAAPGTLDTLNELAAALGDDPNFATTAANNIAAKVTKVTSTDNAIVRFDGTTGVVQNSNVIIDDGGNLIITTGSLKGSHGVGNNSSNTAVGDGALSSNTTGYNNTANGVDALHNNTTGYNNTANGVSALSSNTTGYNNTAYGLNALHNNTTGYNNTANGVDALFSNTTGYNNTANGLDALFSNTTGNSNTANGLNALYNNTTGYYNTANGLNALYNNTTGYYNTANGVDALYNNTTFSNISGFGYNAQVTGSNQVQLGNSATTTYVYGTVANRSDIRDKADIRDTVLGLDFIRALRPVDYKWDMREEYKPDAPNKEDFETDELYKEALEQWLEAIKLSNIVHDGTHKRTRYHQGFIAQEVMALGVEFGGIQDHSINGGDDVLSIGYDELIAPMVKAIQEQQNMISELILRVKTLEEK